MSSLSPQHPSLYKLVASHYFLAALCFVAMAVMLLFASEDLSGHYFHPKLLAITHVAALGWGSVIIFGACYQLLPVILETELFSYKLAWVSIITFFTGLVLFVYSFWVFEPGLTMQLGSVLLVTGIFLFGINVLNTSGKVKTANIYQNFILTSCVWLLATAILGVLMVFNFRYGFLPKDHLQFLKLHAHMGIGGWFLLLIIGVSSKLVPMFLVSAPQKPALLNWSYYLVNTALVLFVLDTYLFGVNSKTYFIATLAASGIFSWLMFIAECVKSRMRKVFDLPIWHTLLSFLLLTLALVILPFIVFFQLKSDPLSVRNTNLYGTLIFMGWISALILGQTFKTLPFIAWVKHYQHLAGKGSFPLPGHLFNEKLLKIQFIVFLVFNAGFYAGLFFQSQILLKAALTCFLLTAVVYFINVLIVIRHKPKSPLYEHI